MPRIKRTTDDIRNYTRLASDRWKTLCPGCGKMSEFYNAQEVCNSCKHRHIHPFRIEDYISQDIGE